MGRRIPANDVNLIHHPHPLLSFTLLAASMAAAIAIISGLCGVRHRRKSTSSLASPSPPPPHPAPLSSTLKKKETSSPSPPPMMKKPPSMEVRMENQNGSELPLPPAKKKLVREAYSCKDMTRLVSSSERKIAASLSMRVTRSLSMVRNRDQIKGKDKEEKGKKLKMEDSIWMKTIILGDKCRVPDEEEEEGNVIYEEQGRKISAYHPRTASSLSISRQCSNIDQESIPRLNRESEKEDGK